jgi:simple sugar transport system substrate-binding protein
MMKKAFLPVLCVSILFALIACNGKEKSSQGKKSDSYVIATVAKNLTEPWYLSYGEAVKQFAQDHDVDAFIDGPSAADSASQIQVIENLIAQGVDAIIISAIDPAAIETVCKKAMDAGIVVITNECDDMVQNCYFDVESADMVTNGYGKLDALASFMGEKGDYQIVIGAWTTVSHTSQADAAVRRQKEKYPNMHLITEDYIETGDTQEGGYEKVKEFLKMYPDTRGFMCTSDMIGIGAAIAVQELGLQDQVSIICGGLPSTHGSYIKNGQIEAVVSLDPYSTAYAANVLALFILRNGVDKVGTTFDGQLDTLTRQANSKVFLGQGTTRYTKENIDQYM